uniref:proteasome subunit beta n=1 Tax=Pseudomonas laurentiana TaxID=2364649 RepID=UPI0029C9310C|nr:proteasome subunit beta [Pseudomonas laurentiana]
MTTIAYKGGVIAYDSRITRGTIIDYEDYEKLVEVKGIKFVLAGATADFPRLIDAYFGAPVTNIDASALAVDGETVWCVGHNDTDGLWKFEVLPDRPYAIGSGTTHALTAMDMGANAFQAVEMAAKRDTSTGGKIRTLMVGTHEQTVSSPEERVMGNQHKKIAG